jgi:hypothetical protein
MPPLYQQEHMRTFLAHRRRAQLLPLAWRRRHSARVET